MERQNKDGIFSTVYLLVCLRSSLAVEAISEEEDGEVVDTDVNTSTELEAEAGGEVEVAEVAEEAEEADADAESGSASLSAQEPETHIKLREGIQSWFRVSPSGRCERDDG